MSNLGFLMIFFFGWILISFITRMVFERYSVFEWKIQIYQPARANSLFLFCTSLLLQSMEANSQKIKSRCGAVMSDSEVKIPFLSLRKASILQSNRIVNPVHIHYSTGYFLVMIIHVFLFSRKYLKNHIFCCVLQIRKVIFINILHRSQASTISTSVKEGPVLI